MTNQALTRAVAINTILSDLSTYEDQLKTDLSELDVEKGFETMPDDGLMRLASAAESLIKAGDTAKYASFLDDVFGMMKRMNQLPL
jgi:hypothetical protein